jgi:hypothetical protein
MSGMAYMAWKMNGHWAELEYGWWSGAAILTVVVVFERPSPPLYVDLGLLQTFEIDEVPCAVRVVGEILKSHLEFVAGEEAEFLEDSNALPLDLNHPVQILALTGGMLLAIAALLAAAWLARIVS